MWKQKIGLSVGGDYGLSAEELMGMLKQIGFDAVSPCWSEGEALEQTARAAKEKGLLLQSLHAPFGKAAELWKGETPSALEVLQTMKRVVEDCARFEIPVMVAHVWIGFSYRFCKDSLDFSLFDRLVDDARRKGVQIAFENTEGEEFLFALMEHFSSENTVGFCWDSGHEMCYNHSQNLLKRFGDRLIMTHLNDNLGISRFDGETFWTDDLHLLPYDGVMDWDDAVARLKQARYQPLLNFELSRGSKPNRHENDCYGAMSLQDYFTEAYKRACKIAYRYASEG